MSNMPTVTALPVKQPLNQITLGFKLGELLVKILGSDDNSLTIVAPQDCGKNDKAAEEEGLEEVIEQLIVDE